jgi:isopentenyl-diphosphate delta-isomerase
MLEELRDQVVVVDRDDRQLATADKVAAHSGGGILHRAVSACLFDQTGRILLQRRAASKYHFAGRWSNAACTHPWPGEQPGTAIARRLGEELGVTPTDLRFAGTFLYRAADPVSGLVEHELDHVYVGVVRSSPDPDPAEVMDWRFLHHSDVTRVDLRGPQYTPWLASVLDIADDIALPITDASRHRPGQAPRPARTDAGEPLSR